MIKIEIPDCSIRLSVSEVDKVNPDSGFYFFRDSSREIVYIGEALNLRKRLNKHLIGNSDTTKRFCHVFHSVDVFYCERNERKIYEVFAINKYNPVGNVDDNESASVTELKNRRKDWIRSLS